MGAHEDGTEIQNGKNVTNKYNNTAKRNIWKFTYSHADRKNVIERLHNAIYSRCHLRVAVLFI